MIFVEQLAKSRRISSLYSLYQVMVALDGSALIGLFGFGRVGQRLIHPDPRRFQGFTRPNTLRPIVYAQIRRMASFRGRSVTDLTLFAGF
jgi:hypothetical protein